MAIKGAKSPQHSIIPVESVLKDDSVAWYTVMFFNFEGLRLAEWSGTGVTSIVTLRLSVITNVWLYDGNNVCALRIAIVFTLFTQLKFQW